MLGPEMSGYSRSYVPRWLKRKWKWEEYARQYAQDNVFASHKLVTTKLDLSLIRLKGAIILLAFVISSHTATVCGNDLKILSRRLLQNRWPNAAYICCASLINKHLTLKVVVTSHKR